MIVRISELRQAIVVRPRLLALVYRRVEIDEVPAGLPGGLHEDFDIALTVEGAGIAAGRVVIDDGVDIGGLAPPHAFEVDAEGGPHRSARDVEGKRGGGDPIRSLPLAPVGIDPDVVHAPEIVWHRESEFGAARIVRLGLRDDARLLLPAGARHAIADDRVPVQRVGLAGRKAAATDSHRLVYP